MKAKLMITGEDYKGGVSTIYRMANGSRIKIQTSRIEKPNYEWGTGVVARLWSGKEWHPILDSVCYTSKVFLRKTKGPTSFYSTDEQWRTYQKGREEEMICILEEVFPEL